MRLSNEDFSRTHGAVNHLFGVIPFASNILETSYYS